MSQLLKKRSLWKYLKKWNTCHRMIEDLIQKNSNNYQKT